jgi:hypothetical protein
MSHVIEHELVEIVSLAKSLADRAQIIVGLGEKLDISHIRRGRENVELAVLTRKYLRTRRQREAMFPGALFADPAWDILLDLFAAEVEGTRVSVTSACTASAVPPTTALRWLSRLEVEGLIFRKSDGSDSRRTFICLTPVAFDRLRSWLDSSL